LAFATRPAASHGVIPGNPLCRWSGVGMAERQGTGPGVLSEMAFYEKVIKVKADVAAYLINCFPFC
jgi:hypothetical protein